MESIVSNEATRHERIMTPKSNLLVNSWFYLGQLFVQLDRLDEATKAGIFLLDVIGISILESVTDFDSVTKTNPLESALPKFVLLPLDLKPKYSTYGV